jgi:hypothetical protein
VSRPDRDDLFSFFLVHGPAISVPSPSSALTFYLTFFGFSDHLLVLKFCGTPSPHSVLGSHICCPTKLTASEKKKRSQKRKRRSKTQRPLRDEADSIERLGRPQHLAHRLVATHNDDTCRRRRKRERQRETVEKRVCTPNLNEISSKVS